jgi:hypothetical protein
MIDRAYCVEEFGLLNPCNPVTFPVQKPMNNRPSARLLMLPAYKHKHKHKHKHSLLVEYEFVQCNTN